MTIGIDASNIRTGGGKKHLEQFVFNALNKNNKITFIIVSNNYINKSFHGIKNIKCLTNRLLNSGNISSFISQIFYSSFYFKRNKCNYVFVPGGIFLASFKPFFTMSQNMLPFDNDSLQGFPLIKRFKFILIKKLQLFSFNRSNGIIFLTDFAKIKTSKHFSKKLKTIVIPHGIAQKKENLYLNNKDDFKILYVSDFLPYKNNLNVFIAVSELINEGYNISLSLIGRKDYYQFNEMKKIFQKHSHLKENIKITGHIPNNDIEKFYKETSLFLFASSCENLPFIVLEALSFGLPIITSNKSPMKDMVYGLNVLFNPSDKNDIKRVILNNMESKKLNEMSNHNFRLSNQYQWKKNAKATIDFFNANI